MIKTSAPGKLVLAGEWSVLQAGNLAIIASVSRRIKIELIPRTDQTIHLVLPDFQLTLTGELIGKKLLFNRQLSDQEIEQVKFLKSAIETVHSWHNLSNGFELKTDSSETTWHGSTTSQKIGFGSSAGVTVAVIKALLAMQNIVSNAELVFKLALISHFNSQGKLGSGLDVASAAYEGIIAYRSFNPQWLINKINNFSITDILSIPWAGCEVKHLNSIKELNIMVGFSGESASTSQLVQQMNNFQSANPQIIEELYTEINQNTEKIFAAWKNIQVADILLLISHNNLLLTKLAAVSGLNLFTPNLNQLINLAEEAGASAKFSGAGGGDCALAFSSSNETLVRIKSIWQKHRLEAIDVELGNYN